MTVCLMLAYAVQVRSDPPPVVVFEVRQESETYCVATVEGKRVATLPGYSIAYASIARKSFVVRKGAELYDWNPGHSLKHFTSLPKVIVKSDFATYTAESRDGKLLALSNASGLIVMSTNPPETLVKRNRPDFPGLEKLLGSGTGGSEGLSWRPSGHQIVTTLPLNEMWDPNTNQAGSFLLDPAVDGGKTSSSFIARGLCIDWLDDQKLLLMRFTETWELRTPTIVNLKGKTLIRGPRSYIAGWGGKNIYLLRRDSKQRYFISTYSPAMNHVKDYFVDPFLKRINKGGKLLVVE